MKIQFPVNNSRYFNTHYKYVLNIFKEFKDTELSTYKCGYFIVMINGKKCLFDFSDYFTIAGYKSSDFHTVFKFHYSYKEKYAENIFPFPPISFYNWKPRNMSYKLNNSFNISMRQRSYGAAAIRRTKIRNMLIGTFGKNVKTRILDRDTYFLDVEDIGIAVFVPGAQENILDRAQLQYMALGAPTISPVIMEVLPFGRVVTPGVHYFSCKNDYSDLINGIKTATLFLKHIKKVGDEAKKLFTETCSPKNLQYWIEGVIRR